MTRVGRLALTQILKGPTAGNPWGLSGSWLSPPSAGRFRLRHAAGEHGERHMSEVSLADIKGALAGLGVSLAPDAQLTNFGIPEGGRVPVIVLDRVRKGWTPDYCVHGFTNCIGCNHICYVGSGSGAVVANRGAFPLCRECGAEWVPPGTAIDGHVADHRRADGPH